MCIRDSLVYSSYLYIITVLINSFIKLCLFSANTGGLLGLFMGFSFLSAVEIFYFLTLRILCALGERKPNSKPQSPNYGGTFAFTQWRLNNYISKRLIIQKQLMKQHFKKIKLKHILSPLFVYFNNYVNVSISLVSTTYLTLWSCHGFNGFNTN